MFEQIDAYVNRNVEITKDEFSFFHSILEYKKFRKKSKLLKAGEICNFEAYVIKGCLRIFYVDKNCNEVNMMFAVEDWWLGDLASFTTQKPSLIYIEAIEDSELLFMSYENKEKLLNQIPKMEKMYRMMLTRSMVTLQNRLYKTISKTAEERYLEFLEKYPTIPQRVPQLYIASYLGISPEFLSKIRKKLSTRKDL